MIGSDLLPTRRVVTAAPPSTSTSSSMIESGNAPRRHTLLLAAVPEACGTSARRPTCEDSKARGARASRYGWASEPRARAPVLAATTVVVLRSIGSLATNAAVAASSARTVDSPVIGRVVFAFVACRPAGGSERRPEPRTISPAPGASSASRIDSSGSSAVAAGIEGSDSDGAGDGSAAIAGAGCSATGGGAESGGGAEAGAGGESGALRGGSSSSGST
jgi:hypothetical protein